MANPAAKKLAEPVILDVRVSETMEKTQGEQGLYMEIIEGLSKPVGEKSLPTLLLYDERGLRLYDAITTHVPEYYLYAAEEEILKNKVDEIVEVMHRCEAGKNEKNGPNASSVVLELGAGALRKTSHILLALSRLVSKTANNVARADYAQPEPPITYYALDVEKSELNRTLSLVRSELGNDLDGKVATKGVCGTYESGLKFVESGGLSELGGRFGGVSEVHWSRDNENAAWTARPATPLSASDSGSTHSSDGALLTPPSSPSESGHTDASSQRHTDTHAAPTPLHILFLGSTLGNFTHNDSVGFLKALPLRPGSGDTLLLGMDHDNSKELVELAYGDPHGYTERFIMNGLRVAGRVLGDERLFAAENWAYEHRYDKSERRHVAHYRATADQEVHVTKANKSFAFKQGELVNIEVSYKYSEADAYTIFTSADLRPIMRWQDSAKQYSLWLVERPAFTFPLLQAPSTPTVAADDSAALRALVDESAQSSHGIINPFGVPTLGDFRTLWKAWDSITMGMIHPKMLFQKPIDLRHICLFYLGHIPTFLDIHLSRLLDEEHTEPEYFKDIFERGIDPHVDDPTFCHPHSEVPQRPEDWPCLDEVVQFRDRVRARLADLYGNIVSGKVQLTRKVGRVLFMTFEHEAFHAETLLYMLLQSAGAPTGSLPPPGFASPPWEALAATWGAMPQPSTPTVRLGPTTVTLGHDDDESADTTAANPIGDVLMHEFGWDNEHPKRSVEVGAFNISWRPITNGQYYEFWTGERAKGNNLGIPASWMEVSGEIQVRSLYGPVPMSIAQHWPMLASYDELSKYAEVQGGRLPTEAELRLFFDLFDCGYAGGANVGFRNWHPVPATTGRSEEGGRGHNGGAWEWTSTTFSTYEGFVPSRLYPGYSADFFDDKHQVVLGGSYATIPRMADRHALRNYYQHNYPYAWVAARIVFDA